MTTWLVLAGSSCFVARMSSGGGGSASFNGGGKGSERSHNIRNINHREAYRAPTTPSHASSPLLLSHSHHHHHHTEPPSPAVSTGTTTSTTVARASSVDVDAFDFSLDDDLDSVAVAASSVRRATSSFGDVDDDDDPVYTFDSTAASGSSDEYGALSAANAGVNQFRGATRAALGKPSHSFHIEAAVDSSSSAASSSLPHSRSPSANSRVGSSFDGRHRPASSSICECMLDMLFVRSVVHSLVGGCLVGWLVGRFVGSLVARLPPLICPSIHTPIHSLIPLTHSSIIHWLFRQLTG